MPLNEFEDCLAQAFVKAFVTDFEPIWRRVRFEGVARLPQLASGSSAGGLTVVEPDVAVAEELRSFAGASKRIDVRNQILSGLLNPAERIASAVRVRPFPEQVKELNQADAIADYFVAMPIDALDLTDCRYAYLLHL